MPVTASGGYLCPISDSCTAQQAHSALKSCNPPCFAQQTYALYQTGAQPAFIPRLPQHLPTAHAAAQPGCRYFDDDCGEIGSGPRCYRCGQRGHLAAACSNEPKQVPCSLCAQFGHNKANCPSCECVHPVLLQFAGLPATEACIQYICCAMSIWAYSCWTRLAKHGVGVRKVKQHKPSPFVLCSLGLLQMGSDQSAHGHSR